MIAGFKRTKHGKGVTERLDELIRKGQDFRPVLKRAVYDEYKLAQIRRWKTRNDNVFFEGGPWKPLNKKYEDWKKKKFKSYPYKGRKMGVATGLLLKSVIGEQEGVKFHRSVVNKQSLFIATTLDYAKWFDKDRTITSFSKKFRERINKIIRDYMKGR